MSRGPAWRLDSSWPDEVEILGHRLRISVLDVITLDDPEADIDPSVVEDRATLYAVECRTCWLVPEVREQEAGQIRVCEMAINRRTGQWLHTYRPRIDDPDQDAVGLIAEHCRIPLVPTTRQRFDGTVGVATRFGDPLPVDEHGLAAARVLIGLGSSPWEAALSLYQPVSR